jgi:hypothetical protein
VKLKSLVEAPICRWEPWGSGVCPKRLSERSELARKGFRSVGGVLEEIGGVPDGVVVGTAGDPRKEP